MNFVLYFYLYFTYILLWKFFEFWVFDILVIWYFGICDFLFEIIAFAIWICFWMFLFFLAVRKNYFLTTFVHNWNSGEFVIFKMRISFCVWNGILFIFFSPSSVYIKCVWVFWFFSLFNFVMYTSYSPHFQTLSHSLNPVAMTNSGTFHAHFEHAQGWTEGYAGQEDNQYLL